MVKNQSLSDHSSPDKNDIDFEKCFVKIPDVGVNSKWFANRLSDLIKGQFGIKLRMLFVTLR